jgi:hypothetical protein
MQRRHYRARNRSVVLAAAFALAVPAAVGTGAWRPEPAIAATVKTPEIRLGPNNRVPRCVTPARLMAFLKSRNPRPDPRYNDIAHWYKHWGEAWRVRWDYAFFQMAIETNFLTYRQPNGRMGDVDPRQHNFAGIGTTGGGVPGDSFPDVKTGVLAQIQHLVAYSGERLATPVAPRTQLKQDDIIEASMRLDRPVRFADLARRWAVDPKYGASIAWVADQFRAQQCPNPDVPPPEEATAQAKRPPKPAPPVTAEASPAPPVSRAAPVSSGPMSGACLIQTASYGGRTTLLIRHETPDRTELTALTVLDGFESSMTDSYIRARAPGGRPIGTFHDQTAALVKARELCPPAGDAPAADRDGLTARQVQVR